MSTSSLMVKVCSYYYNDQMTMAQIGERLNISRHRVGRLLKEAVETGVVRIEIRSPFRLCADLERALERKFRLRACVVADVTADESPEEVKRSTCKAGAGFLRELLEINSTIGIGWGSTTYELVNQLESVELPDATVVQITGGNKVLSVTFDCHEVTRLLARKLGVEPILLHAPGVVDRPQTRELLLREKSIADTFRLYERLDVAVVGIGAIDSNGHSMLVTSGYVPPADLRALLAAGAIADVFSYFINAHGGVVCTELYDRLMTIGLPQIRNIRTKVGIAVGAQKARAVAAALHGGFVNTVVVDRRLAEALLALPDVPAGLPAEPFENAVGAS